MAIKSTQQILPNQSSNAVSLIPPNNDLNKFLKTKIQQINSNQPYVLNDDENFENIYKTIQKNLSYIKMYAIYLELGPICMQLAGLATVLPLSVGISSYLISGSVTAALIGAGILSLIPVALFVGGAVFYYFGWPFKNINKLCHECHENFFPVMCCLNVVNNKLINPNNEEEKQKWESYAEIFENDIMKSLEYACVNAIDLNDRTLFPITPIELAANLKLPKITLFLAEIMKKQNPDHLNNEIFSKALTYTDDATIQKLLQNFIVQENREDILLPVNEEQKNNG